jgi:hypothetical protein
LLPVIILEKPDISQPTTTVLFGSNYNIWIQGMKSFLIGHKLWRIVTGDITKQSKRKMNLIQSL